MNATTVLAGLLAHLKDARQALRSLTSRLHLHRSLEAIDFSHTDADWILEHLTYLDENDPAVLSTHQKNKLFGHDRGATLLAIVHALHLVNDTHTPARERLHTARQSRAGKNLTPLPHLIRGRDLAAVGVTPGPLYRLLFKKIRDAQLSGDIATKKQAHELVQQILQAQQTM